MCTIYSDRHYHTFDGLEYDYQTDCQVYLLKVSLLLKSCWLVAHECQNSLVGHYSHGSVYEKEHSGGVEYVVLLASKQGAML